MCTRNPQILATDLRISFLSIPYAMPVFVRFVPKVLFVFAGSVRVGVFRVALGFVSSGPGGGEILGPRSPVCVTRVGRKCRLAALFPDTKKAADPRNDVGARTAWHETT
jgi:hypothetical protein